MAKLHNADLREAILRNADLCGSDLRGANLSEADLSGAKVVGCRIYGISAWNLKGSPTEQRDLVISCDAEPVITVDNLEIAQFVHLLLNNQKIRNVIDTVGKKGVLILGNFTERKHVLEALRSEIRNRDYLPIVFDFERPTDRDFTETVTTLAGLSRFIIADITKPRSVALEAQVIIPNYMIPFVPIIEEGEAPFGMFSDLYNRDWVLRPLSYDSVEQLIGVLDKAVIDPQTICELFARGEGGEEWLCRKLVTSSDAVQYLIRYLPLDCGAIVQMPLPGPLPICRVLGSVTSPSQIDCESQFPPEPRTDGWLSKRCVSRIFGHAAGTDPVSCSRRERRVPTESLGRATQT